MPSVLRHIDLVVLALALPVFLAAELPMLGYGVLAGVWIVQHFGLIAAERAAARRLAEADRKGAMGFVAASSLGRVWLITLTVLLVGLLGEREAGLAAAILALVLMTVSLGARVLARLLDDEGEAVR